MNWLASHLSKALALLAVALLLVQQCLAATCCCQSRQDGVKQFITGSPANCCSQDKTACGSGASSSERSHCTGSSESKSKPCECPGGCATNTEPITTGSVAIEWSQGNEPTLLAPESISTAAILCAASDVGAGLIVASAGLLSASDHCARFCRFLL